MKNAALFEQDELMCFVSKRKWIDYLRSLGVGNERIEMHEFKEILFNNIISSVLTTLIISQNISFVLHEHFVSS